MSKGDYRDGVWPRQEELRLWYKTRPGNQEGKVKGKVHHLQRGEAKRREVEIAAGMDSLDVRSNKSDHDPLDVIITEIDVLYGDGRPSWDFQRADNGPVVEAVARKHDSVDIVFRRGNPGE
jgi:hypothetical protein